MSIRLQDDFEASLTEEVPGAAAAASPVHRSHQQSLSRKPEHPLHEERRKVRLVAFSFVCVANVSNWCYEKTWPCASFKLVPFTLGRLRAVVPSVCSLQDEPYFCMLFE